MSPTTAAASAPTPALAAWPACAAAPRTTAEPSRPAPPPAAAPGSPGPHAHVAEPTPGVAFAHRGDNREQAEDAAEITDLPGGPRGRYELELAAPRSRRPGN